MSSTVRAFLGIGLPEEVRTSLAAFQRELAASGADVKWVEPPNLHVTLKFLAEITEEQRRALEALLRRVAGNEPAFPLGLAAPGAFPSMEAPRVIWVGLGEGTDVVVRIAQKIDEEGAAISLRREERPFASHITIGRVRSPRKRQHLVARLRSTTWQPPAPWPVSTITLYQSALSSSGPRYSVLAAIPLTK